LMMFLLRSCVCFRLMAAMFPGGWKGPSEERSHLMEKARLRKEKENLLNLISGLRAHLENQEFIDRAPAHIVQAEKDKLARYEIELEKIRASLGV